MIQLFIQPLDTQFHRSGLPFDAGQNTETDSFFPPFPRTVYGALRALGMSRSKGCFGFTDFDSGTRKKVFGCRDSFGSLRILGPVLARMGVNGEVEHSLFFPIPLDLMTEKEEPRQLVLLSPPSKAKQPRGMGCDLGQPGFSFLERCDGQNNELESLWGDYFLPWPLLGDYLLHDHQNLRAKNKDDFTPAEHLFRPEPRTGIARDRESFTAAESMLYSVRHYRMDDVMESSSCGLLVSVDQDEGILNDSGLIQLGGDFRGAGIAPLDANDTTSWWTAWEKYICKKIFETGRFKAFFITPALFRKGCIPDCQGITNAPDGRVFLSVPRGKWGSHTFELKGACIGKPKPVGGWDIQRKEPKPLRKAVPEGSVYFFESANWETTSEKTRMVIVEEIMELYNFKSWCSQEKWPGGSEYGPGKEGFGVALIGGW